jgi:hypothetical protein
MIPLQALTPMLFQLEHLTTLLVLQLKLQQPPFKQAGQNRSLLAFTGAALRVVLQRLPEINSSILASKA